jgi:hypothetical protein
MRQLCAVCLGRVDGWLGRRIVLGMVINELKNSGFGRGAWRPRANKQSTPQLTRADAPQENTQSIQHNAPRLRRRVQPRQRPLHLDQRGLRNLAAASGKVPTLPTGISYDSGGAQYASISGGGGGVASAPDASIVGGRFGKAKYFSSTVLGGLGEEPEKELEIAP